MNSPGRAFVALAALLGVGSLLAWWLPAPWLDWQPELAGREPWRAWTAAFVHWSALHLAANLAGALAVGALGAMARLPVAAALAWAAAWPITHWALWLRPELAHYGGLSGVLHGGAAVVALWLTVTRPGPQRAVGAVLLVGIAAKLLHEEPWGAVLRSGGGWDIAVAPLAHATGAVAGLLCAALALALAPPHPQRLLSR